MRKIGEEFNYQFENGVMRYVVIAHTLVAPNEFAESFLTEEVRAIKWTPSNTAYTRLETGAANADSESNPAVSSG
jgi:hypothetical protein